MDSSTFASRELRFVAVNGQKSPATTDRKERSSVRAFVMRDYLRQKSDPTWIFTPAKVADRMTSHISRFRSARPSVTTKPRNRKIAATRDRKSAARPRAQRPLVPARTNDTDDRSSTSSPLHDLDMLDPFGTLKVDLSQPETQNLLQYYQSAFWANSFACNPEARWISIALTDPAVIHATLSLVAVHRRDCFSLDLSTVYFKHRGEAMKIVADRLNNVNESLSDETIGAVAILSSSDNHFDWPSQAPTAHSKALGQLVAMRGGVDNLISNRQIQRVAAWADLLQSAMHGTRLQIQIPTAVEQATADGVDSDIGSEGLQEPPFGIVLQDLPRILSNMLRQLRILSSLKAVLLAGRNVELCLTFSNMLWKLEYSILDRLEEHSQNTGPNQLDTSSKHDQLSNVVGIATLIFSYLSLRDLAAPILYERLSRRLQDHLSKFMRSLQQQVHVDDYLEEGELVTLLWSLYLGWRGSRLDMERQSWFVKESAQICWRHGILSFDTIKTKIQSVVPQARHLVDIPEEFWAQIEGVIWSDMISLEHGINLSPM